MNNACTGKTHSWHVKSSLNVLPIALHVCDSTLHLLHRPRNRGWGSGSFGGISFLFCRLPCRIFQKVLINPAPLSSWIFIIFFINHTTKFSFLQEIIAILQYLPLLLSFLWSFQILRHLSKHPLPSRFRHMRVPCQMQDSLWHSVDLQHICRQCAAQVLLCTRPLLNPPKPKRSQRLSSLTPH